ncbi:OOP family OmpA-OmpF porin [Rhodovulum imhoffii]|uniref:OOP family OmpA-OmpF porin n=1 Tax=Rhodovulum imhoffii TaxID=365340 RepID=A0A2T5BU45_9RHOB|nr:OmpA family protein [Rhodovulum imhoffii]MBK5934598.1 hypothetical protein [Rhodovulum imhoffii]PTN02985.1 OOP family OmpA-OmpF porin [Rhodovulum imhoffii]
MKTALLTVLPAPALALSLNLPPGAEPVVDTTSPATSHALAVGAWQAGKLPTLHAEGTVTRKVWHVQGQMATQPVMAALRSQLVAGEYLVIFECDTDACGGFDFRYGLDVTPEPDMHVDLGDFRFLSARRSGTEKPDYVSLLISRASTRGFIHMTRIAADNEAIPLETETFAPSGSLADRLDRSGHTVLEDVRFVTGASGLEGEDFASLRALGEYMIAHPEARIALVGHTDAVGGLRGNIALSRARAQAVRTWLLSRFDLPAARIEADGVGYLAPVASNKTEDGRSRNRRVEVVMTSTQ